MGGDGGCRSASGFPPAALAGSIAREKTGDHGTYSGYPGLAHCRACS